MVKIADLVDGKSVKARRERMGLSQGAVAERVRKLSGEKFSQQSLGKFEGGGKSSFVIYILRALDELEEEAGIVYLIPPDKGERFLLGDHASEDAEIIEDMKHNWSYGELLSIAGRMIDELPDEDALNFAVTVMQRALAKYAK